MTQYAMRVISLESLKVTFLLNIECIEATGGTGLVYIYKRKLSQIMTFDEMLHRVQFGADIGIF